MGPPPAVDFDTTPFLIIWETTRSCALACRHCRADAILGRDPGELSTQEGYKLLDEAADMGVPIVVLSGGDPLNRPDLEDLIAYGKSRGLRMGTIPAATPNLTLERIRSLRAAGVDQIAFSLDAPTAELHDGFRRTPGAFAKTLEGVHYAHWSGVPLQINTCFGAWNLQYLEQMVELVTSLKVVFWEVFFLVPQGRGREMEGLTPAQFEAVFERLRRLNREVPFVIKITEAQHYRRFVIRRERQAAEAEGDSSRADGRIEHALARQRGVNGGMGLSPKAVNSGKGFLFVDHLGNICPSGFLPISVGNVRTTSIAKAYRESPLFRDLRDPAKLKGKCGLCEFADVCGGSRARAYALSADPLESDPSCLYQPRPAAKSA